MDRFEIEKHINALKKCSEEHKNDITPTFNIIVSVLCDSTKELLENILMENFKNVKN